MREKQNAPIYNTQTSVFIHPSELRGFSTFEQAVDVRLVRRQGSLVRVYRRKGTMDDGQPTLLNRRASPFDRVLKTEIFRRGELSLFLATACARRAALRRSFLSSRLSSFLFFPFFIFCYETREFGEHSEREESEREKEGKGGGKKKRKEKQERGVFRA